MPLWFLSRLAGLVLAGALAGGAPAPDSLLVLPFANASSNRQLDWVGDSISEILIEKLAAENVEVVAPELRDQAMNDAGLRRYALVTRASAIEAAIQANASLVLYGSFEVRPAAGGSSGSALLRIHAHLLDARRLIRRGSFLIEKPLAELSAAQMSLAWQALRALRPDWLLSEEEFGRSHPAVRLDALENYARGLRAENLEQKHRFLATAARLAPNFSPALYQLGRLNLLGFRDYSAAASWFEKVNSSDIHYRESVFYLGYCRYRTGEFTAAAAAYRQLAAAAPLPEVLNNLGAVLLRLNDPEALTALRSAAEANPADPDIAFNLGYALWRSGRFEEAAEALRRSLQAGDDADATVLLGRCLQKLGPRPGEIRLEGLERLKTGYNEAAWRALRSLVGGP
ncbi:MAG: tetratricopeptide repeat protein [Bryobacteraceae bacterium]